MTEIDRLVVIGLVGALFVLIDWYFLPIKS